MAVLAPVMASFTATATAAAVPVITVSPGNAAPGGLVLVSGSGFTTGQLVRLEICGNNGARGTIDCNQESSEVVPPTERGTFSIALPVVAPPMPCPCVIDASAPGLLHDLTVPLAISGVPTAAVQLPQIPLPPLKVVEAKLAGWGPVLSWFGGSAHRSLELTLQNTSDAPLDVPPLALTRGRGGAPSTIAGTVQGRNLGPHETHTWNIPITFDALSIGRYTVLGRFSTLSATTNFRARTTVFPWGLLVVALFAVQLVLLKIRDRARRRLVPEAAKVRISTPVARRAAPALASVLDEGKERARLLLAKWKPRLPKLPAPRMATDAIARQEQSLATGLRPFADLHELDVLQYWALLNGPRREVTSVNGANGKSGLRRMNGATSNGRRKSKEKAAVPG